MKYMLWIVAIIFFGFILYNVFRGFKNGFVEANIERAVEHIEVLLNSDDIDLNDRQTNYLNSEIQKLRFQQETQLVTYFSISWYREILFSKLVSLADYED